MSHPETFVKTLDFEEASKNETGPVGSHYIRIALAEPEIVCYLKCTDRLSVDTVGVGDGWMDI